MTKWALATMLLCLVSAAGLYAQQDDNLAAMVIEENVKAALLEKGAEQAIPIRVLMDGSTAILTGDVETKVVQELASEVALSVDGVKEVDNRLRIAGAKSASEMSTEEAKAAAAAELADARLESEVKIALYKEIGTKARKLEVEAADGVVSLRGKLPDEARKTIALDTVKRRKDVKDVVDLIEVP